MCVCVCGSVCLYPILSMPLVPYSPCTYFITSTTQRTRIIYALQISSSSNKLKCSNTQAHLFLSVVCSHMCIENKNDNNNSHTHSDYSRNHIGYFVCIFIVRISTNTMPFISIGTCAISILHPLAKLHNAEYIA